MHWPPSPLVGTSSDSVRESVFPPAGSVFLWVETQSHLGILDGDRTEPQSVSRAGSFVLVAALAGGVNIGMELQLE